jgi:hypothetical protein
MNLSRSTPVRTPGPIRAGRGEDALAVRLPVLRAVLERQLRFRREQLAPLDECGEALEASDGAEPADDWVPEAAGALREVMRWSRPALGGRSTTSRSPSTGCVQVATAIADCAVTESLWRCPGRFPRRPCASPAKLGATAEVPSRCRAREGAPLPPAHEMGLAGRRGLDRA